MLEAMRLLTVYKDVHHVLLDPEKGYKQRLQGRAQHFQWVHAVEYHCGTYE
ncbi:hypothetical protein [Salicibibacter halophilus]|uniref:hypothetical protein n=1 Tax=Salicibibacter halophilus TaxID=2502791 RepID=UPI001358419E|nr:hypothetical protein [Salicibibacter halophilus]